MIKGKNHRIRRRALRAIALAGSLVVARSAAAQVPPGLDKGHRILLEKGFQIHAMAVDQPEIPNWSVFDAGGWNGVDFQFNYFAPSAYLGAAPGNHVWQVTYPDYTHTSFSQSEAAYASNCVRAQLLDEQDLNDSTVRTNTASWFAAARANYPDTILSVNQIPFAATDANFRDFMQTSQPDMLMIDSYRWTSDPSQGSWHLYSDWQRHRKFALSGNDGTGAHPIPYGFYTQAVNYGRVVSESELRLEHFGAWAMGYTMTDDFTYNMNASYSGVESIYFVNGSQQANPTASYYQIQSVNAEGKKLGPALVRLLSTDVRFVNGQTTGGTNPNPIDIPNWTTGAGDPYLRGYSVSNIGTKNSGLPGDVLLSWFKVLDESLDGTGFSNEKYFAVTNGLTDPNGSALDCRQQIKLNFDLTGTSITTLLRLSRDTGQVEEVALPFAPGAGLQRQLTIDLDGGTMDLFKFNDGAPFVGVTTPVHATTYWDADGSASGNDSSTGAGLGGNGNWDASSNKWFNGASNAPWAAASNAVFNGAPGTVTLTAPQSATSVSFKSTGYVLAGSALTLSGAATINVDTGVFATIDCPVGGSFGLIKSGTGTLNLTAANTYSGGTVVNGGVLAIAGDSSLGAVPALPTMNLVLNGALLRFNVATTLAANRQINLGAGGATIDTIANNVTIAGQISGTSGFTKAGAGILALTNSNTFTSGILITAGAVRASSDAALGAVPASFTSGNIYLNGGVLQWGSNFDLNPKRGITVGVAGGTLDTQSFSSTGTYGVTNAIDGPGNLTKLGTGSFFASSTVANTLWTGNLIIKEGTWKVNGRGGLPINPTSGGLRPGQVTLDGGTWQFNANFLASEPNRGITIGAGGGTIDVQNFDITWAGPISGTTATSVLTKSGSGLLRLTSSSTASNYIGSTTVAAGMLQLAGGTALGDLSAVTVAAGATLNISSNETIGSLAGGGDVTLAAITLTTGGNNNSTTFGGVISGAGAKLTKTGSGIMTMGGGNTYTGATTVSGGKLRLAQSMTSSSALSVLDGAVVELIASGNHLIKTNTLSIAPTGALDLNDNDLVVNNGSFSAVRALVLQGFGGATGITSSTSDGSEILALFDNALVNATDWQGVPIGGSAIVGKYTYFGDVNFDGQVTGDDYTIIDSNLNTTPPIGLAWLSGDANLDSIVTGDDYTTIDSNLGLGTGNPLTMSAIAVPEPTGMAMGLLATHLLSRRRRNARC